MSTSDPPSCVSNDESHADRVFDNAVERSLSLGKEQSPTPHTAAKRLGFAHSRTSSMMDFVQPRHRAGTGAGVVVAVALAVAVPILAQCPADPLYGGGELRRPRARQ